MLEIECERELLVAQSRFRALVIEWNLGRREVAAVLAVEPERLGLDLIPCRLDAATERRMRLLVEIGGLLPALVRDARDVPLWLRDADALPLAAGGTTQPLAAMSGSVSDLSALRNALRWWRS